MVVVVDDDVGVQMNVVALWFGAVVVDDAGLDEVFQL